MNEDILQNGDKKLRLVSKPVTEADFGSKKIVSLVSRMQNILAHSQDGVALAAPQIGLNLRIFVVSSKVALMTESTIANLVYINPRITKHSRKKVILEEGCLSVRNTYGQIGRYDKVSIEAYDENGKRFTRGGTGLLAEIYQHEIDHLDGILFIDNATDLRTIMPIDNES